MNALTMPLGNAISQLAATVLRSSDSPFDKTEDSAFNPVKNIRACIVCNKLSSDSLIAAAILKHEFPSYHCVDVGQVISYEYDTYIWVGVPATDRDDPLYRDLTGNRNKQHIVILADDNRAATVVDGVKDGHVPDANPNDDDTAVKSTLISKTVQYFSFDNPDYQKLGFHMARFYHRRTELEYQALIYKTALAAWCSIFHGKTFKVPNISQTQIDEYITDREAVKFAIQNNFKAAVIQDGNRAVNAFYTTWDSVDYHLALRMIRLTHKNWINMRYGLDNTIVYTSLRDPKMVTTNRDHPLILR